ncbi:hypothetical protein A2U01_0016959, partial [Trifolium medium]|nr:hypothetical protein [Trifolium medium]
GILEQQKLQNSGNLFEENQQNARSDIYKIVERTQILHQSLYFFTFPNIDLSRFWPNSDQADIGSTAKAIRKKNAAIKDTERLFPIKDLRLKATKLAETTPVRIIIHRRISTGISNRN